MNEIKIEKITSETGFDAINNKFNHEEIEFIWVQSGILHILIDNVKYTLTDGETVFINSSVTHLISSPDYNTSFVSITLKADFITNNTKDITNIKYIVPILSREFVIQAKYSSNDAVSHLIKQCCEELETHQAGYELMVKSYILEIFFIFISSADISKNKNHDKLLYHRICGYITEHYADDLSLDKIASNIHVSKEYICRIFKRHNTTPNKFINQYRVMCSCDMLRNSQLSITDIAMACGFNSISYFNKVFSKMRNQSPSSYRENVK